MFGLDNEGDSTGTLTGKRVEPQGQPQGKKGSRTMNEKRIYGLAGAALLAGSLLVASIGAAAAQTPPTPGPGQGPGAAQPWGGNGPGFGRHAQGQTQEQMTQRHEAMQATVAGALGISVEQLQTELAAGKTVPQIAQERGVDLTTVREAMQAQHQALGGPGGMRGPGGNGPMGRFRGTCPNATT